MSVKVQPKDEQDFKPFDIEMIENGSNGVPNFSFWGEIVLKY